MRTLTISDPGLLAQATPAVSGPPSIAWHAAFWADDPSWTNPGDGNTVGSWRDYSGNGRTASQGTGSQQPLYRATTAALNGRPSVEFDGVDDRLLASWSSVGQPVSLVLICDTVSVPGSVSRYPLIGNNGSGFTSLFWIDSAGLKWAAGGTNNQIVGPALATGGAAARAKIQSGASNSYLTVNGTGYTAAVNVGSDASNGISIGGYYGSGSFYAAVRVAFAAVYVGDVTGAGNWSAFCAWVSAHYGLSLS